jgi:hypothetical protein
VARQPSAVGPRRSRDADERWRGRTRAVPRPLM